VVVKPVIVVDAEAGLEIVAIVPLTCVHAYDAMVPSESVPDPDTVTVETGNVIVWVTPAFAVGDWLAAAFTVTVTSAYPVAPWLSVTVKRNTLTPTVLKAVIVVAAELGLVIIPAVPLICVHAYEAIVPSGSVPPPFNITVVVGRLIVCELPASAVGGIFAGFTVIVTSEVPLAPWLSVTVKRNTLAPGVVNPVMVVDADEGLLMVAAVPLICIQP